MVELLLLKWELFIIFIQKKYLNPEVAKEDRTHMGKDMQQFITPIQKFPHLQLISGLKRNLHKDNLLASMTDLIIILIPTMFLLYLKDFHYDKRKAKHKKEDNSSITTPELVAENPFVNMFNAVKRAILTVREDEENIASPPLFKTIMIDNGQFLRLIRDDNLESEIAFPAIFVHFTNVRYLVQQQRVGEGRATMRVRFILNTFNNQDIETECDPFIIFQRINVAIQDAKDREPALNERCNLMFLICLPQLICFKLIG